MCPTPAVSRRLVAASMWPVALLLTAAQCRTVQVEHQDAVSGPLIEIRVAPGGSTDVFVDGVAETSDRWMEFDLAAGWSGSHAFAQMALSVRESVVWRDGEIVGAGAGQIHTQPTFLPSHLAWLRYDHGTDASAVCLHRRGHDQTTCHDLPFYADRIVADRRGRLLVLGFDADSDRYVAARLGREGSLRTLIETSDSLHLSHAGPEPSIVRVTGSDSAMAVYFSMLELTRSQFGEPLAHGSDDLGRLAWNTRYRIDAMAQLADLIDSTRFDRILEEATEAILVQADADGRFTSGKYSIDRQTPIALLLNNAAIHLALVRALPRLPPALQDRVLASASAMMDSFEDDWDGAYRFTPCIAHEFDGIVTPLNHQSLVGLLVLELYRWTGDLRFLDRAAGIWSSFAAELEIVEDTALWPYWPDRFSAGWSEGDWPSCNTPSRPARWDDRYSDARHARIDMEFARAASEALGIDSPVDVHAIGRNLEVAPNRFANFISGHVDAATPASYRNLPFLPWADAIAPYYTRRIVLPALDVDRQALTLSYARAAQQAWDRFAGPWELTRTRYSARRFHLKPEEIEVIRGSTAADLVRIIDLLWPKS